MCFSNCMNGPLRPSKETQAFIGKKKKKFRMIFSKSTSPFLCLDNPSLPVYFESYPQMNIKHATHIEGSITYDSLRQGAEKI